MGIAFSITTLVFVLGLVLKTSDGESFADSSSALIFGWYEGLWDNSSGGLYFAFQMILILVLGHVLALTTPFRKFIYFLTSFCTNNTNAVVTVAITAIILGYINWGLALVLSALMVKQIIEKFSHNGIKLNVGLLGAAAYSCMLVWHGGLSGSSPTKASESGAIQEMLINAGYTVDSSISNAYSATETLFSNLNVFVFFVLLILLPLSLFFLAKRHKSKEQIVEVNFNTSAESHKFQWNVSVFIGLIILAIAVFVGINNIQNSKSFLNVNFINFCLLGLGILFHNGLDKFSEAVNVAIRDASGILIQFPIYFGIIGLMKSSGLSIVISEIMVNTATADSFPILSFLSAGLLNFFIPSGGGQFYIQGPMLINSAQELGVSIPKTIMALSYGDQWTNMLQPFWALPLIGITKIKLSVLLPYCLVLFLVSGLVFCAGLMIF